MFKIRENQTKVSTEIIAGLTTFFAMSYIIFVNPGMLSQTGIPYGGVFLATIISSVVGTLVMGLFANVPYAQAPGMGMNAFFTYTVVFALGFSWKEALAMVFICGIINILITVTRVRKMIVKSIPPGLQNAIGGGIGIFIAYIGLKNAGLLGFTISPGRYISVGGASDVPASATVVADSSAVPGLVTLNSPGVLLALIGLVITVVLVLLKVKGAVLIGILATTFLAWPMGVLDTSALNGLSSGAYLSGFSDSFGELGQTFGAAFGRDGVVSLFSDITKLPIVLMTIFAFSLSDTFDTIGTFIGTGRQSGIFSAEDENALESGKGFSSKMDRALFSDAIATSIGAVFGTSNTTTYVESAAGIAAGGRTGLTSVVTAFLMASCAFLAPVAGIVPAEATSAALIMVGIMMLSAFKEIEWTDMEEAIPAFFAGIFMALCYSISYGIAFGFISHILVKFSKGKAKEVHPVIWVSALLFIANFVIMALL